MIPGSNILSLLGLDKVAGFLGKVLSVGWEWITQKADAAGNKKGWGTLWQEQEERQGLMVAAQASGLGIADPKAFVAELMKPVEPSVSQNSTATNFSIFSIQPNFPDKQPPPKSTEKKSQAK